MAGKKLYRDYFNIDPKYYAAVTADLIESGMVSWKSFYPHETFVKLLEKTHTVLSGKDPRSLWVEGAYGTGKSHAALTVKSLLDATDEEVKDYFDDYGLSKDLCQKIIADKNDGLLITIHRIGSGSIRSDQDLILAVQDSVMSALEKNGITNRGEASLRDAALKWLEKKANRDYFNTLIAEEQYAWTFGGNDVDAVIDRLQNGIKGDLEQIIARCVTIKAEVVNADEFDNGLRGILNFGHTVGHAVEKCSHFAVSHGCAVAIGMVIVSKAAALAGICDKSVFDRVLALVQAYGLPTTTDYDTDALLQAMLSDKKRAGAKISLIIPEAMGKVRIEKMGLQDMDTFLRPALEGQTWK